MLSTGAIRASMHRADLTCITPPRSARKPGRCRGPSGSTKRGLEVPGEGIAVGLVTWVAGSRNLVASLLTLVELHAVPPMLAQLGRDPEPQVSINAEIPRSYKRCTSVRSRSPLDTACSPPTANGRMCAASRLGKVALVVTAHLCWYASATVLLLYLNSKDLSRARAAILEALRSVNGCVRRARQSEADESDVADWPVLMFRRDGGVIRVCIATIDLYVRPS